MNQLECRALLGIDADLLKLMHVQNVTHLFDIEILFCSWEEPCLDRPFEYLHFISRVFAANLGKCITLHTPLPHFPRGNKGSQLTCWQQIRLLGWNCI